MDGVLATGGGESVRLWEAKTLEVIGEAKQSRCLSPSASFAFSPDGSGIVIADRNETRLWDTVTGQPVGAATRYEGIRSAWVRAIAFVPDGLRAVITVDKHTHQLFDGDVGSPVGPAVRCEILRAVTISPDGSCFATSGQRSGGTIDLWDATTGARRLPPIVHGGVIHALAFSADGFRILSGGNTRAAMVWDASSGQAIGTPLRQRNTVNAVAFSSSGERMLTGSEDGSARVWEHASSDESGRRIEHSDRVLAAAYSKQGLRVLIERDRQAQLIDDVTGQVLGRPLAVQHADSIHLSPDDSYVVINHRPFCDLWRVATGERVAEFSGVVHGVAYSPDGSRVLTGNENGKAIVWDGVTGKRIGRPLEHQDTVVFVGYSLDGSLIVTGSHDGTTRFWDANSLEPMGAPLTHQSEVKSAAYSPDGRRVLIGFADGSARLWDATTTALTSIGTPLQHQNIVCGTAFSSDSLAIGDVFT